MKRVLPIVLLAGGCHFVLDPDSVPPPAPSGLTYAVVSAVYTLGQTIASNVPSSGGGPVVSYAINPSLPEGLGFNTTTGVISGTPAVLSPATDYTVTATNAGGSTTATLTIAVLSTSTSATAIDFISPAWTSMAGACLGPVRIQAEDAAGNPSLLSSDATVALTASAPQVTFFSDAPCAQAISSVVLAAGAPEAAFYFRSRATGAVTLRASAGSLGSPTQTEQIVPNVRAGSCTIGAGSLFAACSIGWPGVLDASRAFLVVQAISDDNNASGVNVRCSLADAGTIDCNRYAGTGTVEVAWQLVALAAGIRVQRVNNSQCTGSNPILLPQVVNPSQTFVLFTAEGAGAIVESNDYRMVRLVGNDRLEVMNDIGCANGLLDVQVVELEGAVVERGVADAGLVTSVTVTTASAADPARSFLLHSARFTGAAVLCGYQIRGTLAGPNTITFTRGDGNDAVCQSPDLPAIAWERVTLPPGGTSQQLSVSMVGGQTFATASITPVDPARSFTFSSSQFNAGAGFGETSFNGDDRPGAAGARHRLAAGNRLELNRAVDAGTARWTSYVVELP